MVLGLRRRPSSMAVGGSTRRPMMAIHVHVHVHVLTPLAFAHPPVVLMQRACSEMCCAGRPRRAKSLRSCSVPVGRGGVPGDTGALRGSTIYYKQGPEIYSRFRGSYDEMSTEHRQPNELYSTTDVVGTYRNSYRNYRSCT